MLVSVIATEQSNNLRRKIKKMLKQNSIYANKQGSSKTPYAGVLASGLNRRAFLKTSIAISLLAGFTQFKPAIAELDAETKHANHTNSEKSHFTQPQLKTLDAVQMQLFPDDGNGPSARNINALGYLQWALSDPHNIDDGDPEFIAKGIIWLNELSTQKQNKTFITLTAEQQDKILKQIATSQAGENWLALLMYYLTEALMLDPIYGGNTAGIGWQWLEHQAGFPRPIIGKTYRDFEVAATKTPTP